MATNKPEIASLVQEINLYAEKLLRPNARNEKEIEENEKARQKLVQAAEKLTIASQRPDENLYATATNVWHFCFIEGEPENITLATFFLHFLCDFLLLIKRVYKTTIN